VQFCQGRGSRYAQRVSLSGDCRSRKERGADSGLPPAATVVKSSLHFFSSTRYVAYCVGPGCAKGWVLTADLNWCRSVLTFTPNNQQFLRYAQGLLTGFPTLFSLILSLVLPCIQTEMHHFPLSLQLYLQPLSLQQILFPPPCHHSNNYADHH
jgi:hypothetical protein